jgi:hypothetical protein
MTLKRLGFLIFLIIIASNFSCSHCYLITKDELSNRKDASKNTTYTIRTANGTQYITDFYSIVDDSISISINKQWIENNEEAVVTIPITEITGIRACETSTKEAQTNGLKFLVIFGGFWLTIYLYLSLSGFQGISG